MHSFCYLFLENAKLNKGGYNFLEHNDTVRKAEHTKGYTNGGKYLSRLCFSVNVAAVEIGIPPDVLHTYKSKNKADHRAYGKAENTEDKRLFRSGLTLRLTVGAYHLGGIGLAVFVSLRLGDDAAASVAVLSTVFNFFSTESAIHIFPLYR